MADDFLRTWKRNQGNLLLLLAGIAAVLVSSVWYFDLLPNIELVGTENRGTARSVTRQPTVLVVTVLTAATPAGQEMRGRIMICQPFDQVSPELVPLATRDFQTSQAKVQALVITSLPPGTYAALAYLDPNGNGRLDFDEQGLPIEPVRLSHPMPNNQSPADPLNLEEAVFRIRPGQATNVRFNLDTSPKAAP